MSISLYKPNSKNTGCAFNFKIGVNKSREPVIYASAIQQYSWDDNKKTGNFSGNGSDPDKRINLKFTEFEIGGIISAFKHRNDFSTFHSFEDNKTSIKCAPWDKKTKVKQGDKDVWVTLPAFGINVTRNGNQVFRIPLEPGEVENLAQFFNFYLSELYKHRRREEIKRLKESRPSSSQASSSSSGEEAPF